VYRFPLNQYNPTKALLIRRIINIIEIALPGFIYYFHVALNKNNLSLSDSVSKCIVVRKKYLFSGNASKKNLSQFEKYISPLIFSFLPIIIFIVLALILTLIFQYEIGFETLLENLFEEEKKK